MFVGDFGDAPGRRLSFIECLVVYPGADVGLEPQTNHAALMVLSCPQNLGSSHTLALGYVVVADMYTGSSQTRLNMK